MKNIPVLPPTGIDAHCHLTRKEFSSVDEVVSNARKIGVQYFLNVNTSIEEFENNKEKFKKYPYIFHSLGYHPHNAKSVTEKILKNVEKISQDKMIICIGEIGLDYFRDLSPREIQKNIFIRQLEIAKKIKKPVMIHARNAEYEAAQILTDVGFDEEKVIFHSFDGDLDVLEYILERKNWFLSFSANIFKKDGHFNSFVKTPINRFFIETDSPFLPPFPFKMPNEPKLLAVNALQLSKLRKMQVQDLWRISAQNFKEFFKDTVNFS